MKSAIALFLSLLSSACLAEDVELFNGRDLAGWRQPVAEWQACASVSLDAKDNKHFAIQPGTGVLVNGPQGKTKNLISQPEFGDVSAHIEFIIPAKSNSGVYLMGRYEVQVYDSFGLTRGDYPGIECGSIYSRWINNQRVEGHSPRVNAARPPGEWQSFDVVFRAPRFDSDGKKIANACFVKVVHNGQVVHENVEVTGPTRAAAFNDEKPMGPLMLQGDHGPVAYRNIRIVTARQ